MNPPSLTPMNLPDSHVTLQAYRDDPQFSANLYHAARRERARVIGRLAARLFAKIASLRVSRSAARPMALPLARWG